MAVAAEVTVRKLVEEREGREWCLFVDRDGVLNRHLLGDYVRSWPQFEWLPGAPAALRILRRWAPNIVVVTNQQGIGKGLMTDGDLEEIHQLVQDELAADGRALDAFKVCPHLESMDCECRKPSPALVLDWLAENPDCDPALSIIVGDGPGDLQLARNVAAKTGGCTAVHVTADRARGDADLHFASLWDFAAEVAQARGDDAR